MIHQLQKRTLPKYSTHRKRNGKAKYKQYYFYKQLCCVWTHGVTNPSHLQKYILLVEQAGVRNSLFLRKHHLVVRFKLVWISCFPHCSNQWFHLYIQNAICELLWVRGYVHSTFPQQQLGHSIPLGTSTQCETYISVCVETLTCSHVDSELQSPTKHRTETHHDFTSNKTIMLSVDETCCPFVCWRTEEIMSFVAMRETGEKHILNLRSMR